MSTSKQESHTLSKRPSFVDKLRNSVESSPSIMDELYDFIANYSDPIMNQSQEEFISLTSEQLRALYIQLSQHSQQRQKLLCKLDALIQEKPTTLIDNNARFFSNQTPEIDPHSPLGKVKQFITSNNPNKILLLADDTLSQLKILARHVKNQITHRDTTTSVFQNISPEQWIIEQVQMELFNDNWGIIYAADGDIALKIINLGYPITALITDQNMPQKDLQGIDLIRAVVKKQSLNIALHTSDSIEQFNTEQQELIEKNNVTFIGKGEIKQIKCFMEQVFEKIDRENIEKPQIK